MSFASASQPAPGKRPGKQNRPRLGLRGCTEVPKASHLDGVRRLALRPVMQAASGWLQELPVPKVTRSPLLYAFCCFPPASPAFTPEAGKQKAPRRAPFIRLKSLRDFGAGEGIRTLDPNLGNIPPLREAAEYGGFQAMPRRHSGTPEHFRELGRVRSSKGEEPSFINRPKRWRRPGGNRD